MAAALGGPVAGTLQTGFAALSFAGAGYLFQHLNGNGYGEEMKRHNKALEELARAKEVFYENEVKRRNRIEHLRQELSDANADIEETNKALDHLKATMERANYNGRTLMKEPRLSDFYRPSQEMKEYQELFSGAIGIATGYVIYLLI